MIPVSWQSACRWLSHKAGGKLPLVSTGPRLLSACDLRHYRDLVGLIDWSSWMWCTHLGPLCTCHRDRRCWRMLTRRCVECGRSERSCPWEGRWMCSYHAHSNRRSLHDSSPSDTATIHNQLPRPSYPTGPAGQGPSPKSQGTQNSPCVISSSREISVTNCTLCLKKSSHL